MAELVDALVLGTNSASCEGSSPFSPTTNCAFFYMHMWIEECNIVCNKYFLVLVDNLIVNTSESTNSIKLCYCKYMKKINPKKIISKSYNHMSSDFNNFVRIAAVPFIVMAPLYLFTTYYDEYVLDIYNQKGMVAYIRGSGLTKLIDWFIIFPLTSAFLANWHRYILFSRKKPWKYFPIDFSKYTFRWMWTSIKVAFVFFVPAVVFIILTLQIGINFIISVVIYILLFIIYAVRVSLIFPATAAQHDTSFTRAFKMSKNNFWSLLLIIVSIIPVFIAWFLLILLIEFTVGAESSIITFLFVNFITFAFVFIIYGYLASCLSESYKVLSNI